MAAREHERVPINVQVDYRTASSFLVAYSVNLSRGGIFLETPQPVPAGADVSLQLTVPGTGAVRLVGTVTWARLEEDAEGAAGMGIEFADLGPELGTLIDQLVADYAGVSVLLVARDAKDRAALKRVIRSIIATADVVSASDMHVAETLLTEEIDVVVVELDGDTDDGIAVIRRARALLPPVPVIALAASRKALTRATAAGADEIAPSPASFTDLQRRLVRALGRPVRIG